MRTLIILAILMLAACQVESPAPLNQTLEPVENATQNATEPVNQTKGPEKVNLTSTPKHECALLEVNEGHSICGTEYQISGEKDYDGASFSCTQTFIHGEMPFEKVIIKVMDYKTPEEAQEKYEWDLKVLQGEESKIYPDFFIADIDDNSRYEFVRGRYVGRIMEVPTGACRDFEEFKDLVIKRLQSEAQGLR